MIFPAVLVANRSALLGQASDWLANGLVSVLLLLAFSVYSQRTSLQDCADKVKGNFAREGTSVTVTDTECSFFGTTVTVKDPRTGTDSTDSTDSTEAG